MVGGPPKSLRPLDHPNHSESPDPLPTPTNNTNSNSTTLIIKPPDQLDHHGQLSWSPWLPQPTDFSDHCNLFDHPGPEHFQNLQKKRSEQFANFVIKWCRTPKKNVRNDNLQRKNCLEKQFAKFVFWNVNLKKNWPECQIAKDNRFNIWSNYLIMGQWFNNG